MKKRLTGLISLILSLLLCLSFSACNLITYDSDREMKQVVATVSINENVKDEITLGDLVLSYINGGYLNEQYYGYTTEQNFDILLNQLVSQRILLQNAMIEFEADENFTKNTEKEYTPLRYLSEKEIVDAKYESYSALNNYIKSFAEAEEEGKKDTWVGERRTIPTGATNDVKEKTLEEKKAYIANGVDKSDLKALNKAIESLDENAMLGDAYKASGVMEDIEYFKLILEESYEQQVLNIYYENLLKTARSEITFEVLESIYASMYAKQANFTNAEFVEKLSSATVDSPLLYGGFGGYGYVYNLLLGASDIQKEKITKIKEDDPGISDAKYSADRKAILDQTTVKDLRSYWVYSGYDAEVREDGKLYFTGDYTLTKNSEYSFAYQGEVTEIKPAENGETAKYAIKSTDSIKLDEFISRMDEYLGSATENNFYNMGDDVYGAKTFDGEIEELDAKINELLFAFSTDAGSLNTYKGYVIKPEVEGTATEQYVKTFGDAGRKLLTQNKDGYVIVASDYGYQVMFYSKVLSASLDHDNLTAYLEAIGTDKTGYATYKEYYNAMLADYEAFEETDSYLFKLASTAITTNSNTYQQNKVNEIVNKYLYNEDGEHPNCVSINKKVYEEYYK